MARGYHVGCHNAHLCRPDRPVRSRCHAQVGGRPVGPRWKPEARAARPGSAAPLTLSDCDRSATLSADRWDTVPCRAPCSTRRIRLALQVLLALQNGSAMLTIAVAFKPPRRASSGNWRPTAGWRRSRPWRLCRESRLWLCAQGRHPNRMMPRRAQVRSPSFAVRSPCSAGGCHRRPSLPVPVLHGMGLSCACQLQRDRGITKDSSRGH